MVLPTTHSTISWYHLPPKRGYLTLSQWAWIAGAFLLPIVLAMLIGSLRSRRARKSRAHRAGFARNPLIETVVPSGYEGK